MEKVRLTLYVNPNLATAYGSCREFVAERAHNQHVSQKVIAANMDLSPSDLSRKLSQHPDDSRRFTLDDLEKFIQVTGDKTPVEYLAVKYLFSGSRENIQAEIDKLKALLDIPA